MDAPTPPTTQVEIVYNQQQIASGTSLKPPTKPRSLSSDEILKLQSEKKLQSLSQSPSQSSSEDSLDSYRELNRVSTNLIAQLENNIEIYAKDKEERKKKETEFQSLLGDVGKNHDTIFRSLTALQEAKKQDLENNKKLNDILISIGQRIETLEKLGGQSSNTSPIIPTLKSIMSTSRLNSVMASRSSSDDTPQIDEQTLEDILTQQQEQLDNMRQQILKQLTTSNNDTNYQQAIDDLKAEVVTLKNNNHSLMRKVQFFMTGSVAVLMASFWIWWQTHKA